MIYDNACNLHNYCLNREPQYFKNAWFIVDRFHWRNHTGYDDNVIIVDKQLMLSVSFFFLNRVQYWIQMSSYPQLTNINSAIQS